MIKRITQFSLVCMALLSGCMNGGLQPAVLDPRSASHDQDIVSIEVTISEMLNGTPVNISNSAFSDSHELILERTAQNQLGRSYERPLHFRLWLGAGGCRIEYVESGEMRNLEGLSCSPLTP